MANVTKANALRKRIQVCWEAAAAIEPVAGAVRSGRLDHIRTLVEAMAAAHRDGVDGLTGLDRMDVEVSMATALARAAVVAVVAGDEDTARAWLTQAAELTSDDQQREELEAGAGSLERYRVLVHGRNRFAADDVEGARALWQTLVDGGGDDALQRAAAQASRTPRTYRGNVPELFTWNTIGTRFFGRRDEAPDGSYVTTCCLSALAVPLLPLAAYRVLGDEDGFVVLSKEPLSPKARYGRMAAVTVAVLGVAAFLTVSYLRDPDRLARQRFDASIAARGEPEAALARLDGELGGPDLARVGDDRAQRAGAAVVRLTAGYVPEPFGRAHVDQVARVVARYRALPERARGGAAREAIVRAVTGWAEALDAPEEREAQLVVLRQALAVAGPGAGALAKRVIDVRLEVAASRAADRPLDALGLLVEDPRSAQTVAQASAIIARLADQPSLLEDAGADLDVWLADTADEDPLHVQVEAQRALAVARRPELEAEDLAPAQLAAMQEARPWDQAVAARLASEDLHGGALAAAEARLRSFGPPGMMTREARLVLAQIAAADGKLDAADDLLSNLLAARLPRFQAASAAFVETANQLQARLERRLDTDAPADLIAKVEGISDEGERNEIVRAWFAAQMEADPAFVRDRAAYLAYSDVVPVAVNAGTLKLRRAQGLGGPARDAMLADAEATFLAIRSEAEGQPEFHLGLGEIYARLGKMEESNRELDQLLARDEPGLTLEVVGVYRNIGSIERAIQIATEAYGKHASPVREEFASMLGTMTAADDEVSEAWYRKSDLSHGFNRTALLEIEGRRQARLGKYEECARTYAAAAKAHLEGASGGGATQLNNAAVAHQGRYQCSGDPRALADAESALEQAYRMSGESPILLGNLINVLAFRGTLRVLGRRIDLRALRLAHSDADEIIDLLLDGSERDVVLAELTADPALRRSRELVRQQEVLSPNRIDPYWVQFEWAAKVRDQATAGALLDRLRQAKALDTSEAREARERFASGADVDQLLVADTAELTRLDAVLAKPNLETRTRATALRLRGQALARQGLYRGLPADLAAARVLLQQSDALWPAQADPRHAAAVLVDEVAARHDATRWLTLRRQDDAFGILARLAESRDPLADTIRGAPAWATVRELLQGDRSRPGLTMLLMAPLLADPELETRAQTARADPLLRMQCELRLLASPDDPGAKADLALFRAR